MAEKQFNLGVSIGENLRETPEDTAEMKMGVASLMI
ncbi:MAG: hypothetical protein ACJARO_001082, partial [Bacteriovoracaceae bacterium]